MPRQHPTEPTASQPTKHTKQTGPKTPAWKAKSRMNAVKHGLRAAAAVLPGEDPEEYEVFVAGAVDSLAPVGMLEEELARQIAQAQWRLRRTDTWEAAHARLAAHADAKEIAATLATADADIAQLRAELAASQRDPAADPPFEVTLPDLPDDAPVDPPDVSALRDAWARHLPDPDKAPTLEQMCDRAGLPEAVTSQLDHYPGWTAGLVRRVVAEFARDLGVTLEEYLAEPVEEWQAGLADERARRRHGRGEIKRQIAVVEQRKRDLVMDRAGPDAERVDLLARYEAGAQRKADKALKALLALQENRRVRTRRGASAS